MDVKMLIVALVVAGIIFWILKGVVEKLGSSGYQRLEEQTI